MMPNYLISASDDAVVLRNFEGMMIRYQAEDKPNTTRPAESRGVSALLQGTKSALIPADSERMARRKSLNVLNGETSEPEHEHVETNGHSNGCCGGSSTGHAPNATAVARRAGQRLRLLRNRTIATEERRFV